MCVPSGLIMMKDFSEDILVFDPLEVDDVRPRADGGFRLQQSL